VPWLFALDGFVSIEKPFSLEKGFSGGCPIINNGRDIVKLLKLQYNKVNTMSMM
jgi:hypothetical protein